MEATADDADRSTEYIALVGSFLLVGLEAIIRILTLALREHRRCLLRQGDTWLTATAPFLVNLCYRASRRIFHKFSSPAQKKAENRKKCMAGPS